MLFCKYCDEVITFSFEYNIRNISTYFQSFQFCLMGHNFCLRLHGSDRSLPDIGWTLKRLKLPRPKSESNFASQDMPSSLNRNGGDHIGRINFQKSDSLQ